MAEIERHYAELRKAAKEVLAALRGYKRINWEIDDTRLAAAIKQVECENLRKEKGINTDPKETRRVE